jgi:predicted acylesterase/phospholipase RssA
VSRRSLPARKRRPAPGSAVAADASERPKLGLALGGGAARGIAHIGFLQWLEEHRVPVDFIAGTSTGGLVGGAYAAGMTPEEIRELMRDADWDIIFLADSPFKYKTFRRKEDAREFPALIELGLKSGLKLPSGLNAGQGVQTLLDRIAARPTRTSTASTSSRLPSVPSRPISTRRSSSFSAAARSRKRCGRPWPSPASSLPLLSTGGSWSTAEPSTTFPRT